MSGKREHRKRNNMRLQYIAAFNRWLEAEPPMILFWRWRKWKKCRPVWNENGKFFPSEKLFCKIMLSPLERLLLRLRRYKMPKEQLTFAVNFAALDRSIGKNIRSSKDYE